MYENWTKLYYTKNSRYTHKEIISKADLKKKQSTKYSSDAKIPNSQRGLTFASKFKNANHVTTSNIFHWSYLEESDVGFKIADNQF